MNRLRNITRHSVMSTRKNIILTAILLLSALYVSAYDFSVDGIQYNFIPETDQAEVAGIDADLYNKDIVIPGTVLWEDNVYQVTAIGERAFYNINIKSCRISEGVKMIGTYAFVSCRAELIVLPNTLKEIGYASFERSYIRSITIPASVEFIDAWAFTKCPYLEYIVFEGSVRSISFNVFAGYSYAPQAYTVVVNGEPFKIDNSLGHVDLENSVLIVPVGMTDQYLEAPGWGDFGTILENIPVTDISLDKTSVTLPTRKTEQLTAVILPENAAYKKVSWKSSAPDIASVSQTGLVSTYSAGEAIITATTADGGYTATCEVEVYITISHFFLNRTHATMFVGDTEQLTAIIYPENVTDKTVTWSSSAPDIASVSQSGLVTSHSGGSATITATAADGGHTVTCEISVIILVTGVHLNKTTVTLISGESEQLEASIEPDDATNQNVTWSINIPAVATVSQGLVTARSAGTAIITVTTSDGGFAATCEVKVIIPVNGIYLNRTSATLVVGETEYLTATILPVNAIDRNVSWASNAPEIASVSQTGLVTSHSAGTATITVTTADGGYTATCELLISPVTGFADITNTSIILYMRDDCLLVDSPVSEIITVYSVSGTLIFTKNKQAGETIFPLGIFPNQMFIVKGSSGWAKKVIQYE